MKSTRIISVVAALVLAACTKSTPPPPPAPFAIADIFPPGAGREMVLDTCGSCHPVVCCARGQRTADRWDSIHNGHKDKLSGRPAADLVAMFTYLKTNFNETKPEPQVPPEFLQQGCTPF